MSRIYVSVMILLSTLFIVGCGGYPEVSRGTLDLAKALSFTCNERNSDQLPKARELIQSGQQKGEITKAEAGYLNDIVALAESGQWSRAEEQSLTLLQDQTAW